MINIFLGDLDRVDTIVEGKTEKERLNSLAFGQKKIVQFKSTPVDDPFKVLDIFGNLGLVDISNYSIGSVDTDKLQDFVSGLENFENADAKQRSVLDNLKETSQGIGSFSTFLFAKLFLQQFGSDGTTFRKQGDKFPLSQKYKEPEIRGKIRDYLFIADADRKGGAGHLSVDMFHPTAGDNANAGIFYHWDIKVHRFTVHERVDDHFPNNPFPTLEGKVTFPDFSLDPDDKRSIWSRCLDHKLFAEGKDDQGNDNFTVEHIYRSIDGGPLERLPSGPTGHPWYVTTKQSCIDLMFKGFPPAAGLPPQANYCLGRCEHPKIINTCGGG